MPESWKAIAARKQAERGSRIPPEWRLASAPSTADDIVHVPQSCGVLTAHELHLTEDYDATALLEELSKGGLQAAEVVTAFCKRAAIAQQATNCLTEILFEDALARARQLDAHFLRTGKPLGALHGLPISLKDTFRIKGYDASLGIASLCFKPAESNSALVDLLLAQGAVLYCKTNVPQTLSALDSHNNVFGRTLNPRNTRLTAGGSSGGEGALIAMRGSVLGVGTDIGGSIRIPAACNGLFGVKPSHGRVPYAGQASVIKPGSSKLGIEPTAGPIATSVRDCEMFLRVVSDASPEFHDPEVAGMRWANQPQLPDTSLQPLRVGLVRTDGHVTPLPPIDKVMEEIAQTLRTTPTIELVEVDAAALLSRVLKPFNGFMSVGGANEWFDVLDETNEPLSPWLQGKLARRSPKSLDQVRELHEQKSALRSAFLRVWHRSGGYWRQGSSTASASVLDCLLLPVAPHPIPPIDRWNTVNYTAALNFLDLPAGLLPLRSCTRADLQTGELASSSPRNGWDAINRKLWTDVDRSVYLSSPLCVQVVTQRLCERKLLAAMALLQRSLEPLTTRNALPDSKL